MDKSNVDFKKEGSNPFKLEEENEETTLSDSQSEKNKDGTQSDQGDDENTNHEDNEDGDDTSASEETNNKVNTKKDVPFHKHPRWIKREREWKDKFNSQEKRHDDAIAELRNDIGKSKKNDDQTEKVPSWFGGDQENWNAYKKWHKEQVGSIEKGTFDKISQEKSSNEKAIKEAKEYMDDQIELIESDEKLNPNGLSIDQNKLLKFVIDNDLVDSKGRWNYKAGFKMMIKSSSFSNSKNNNANRKKIAGAINSKNNGESKFKAFKTSKDFEIYKPW